MTGRRTLGVVAVALVAATGAAAPVALAGAGHWDAPPLDELDLGAAGAEAADGRWSVLDLRVDGATVAVDGDEPVVIELDTVLATLAGDTGCSLLLGSFTLTPDGEASFTVPSPQRAACPDALLARDDAVRAALAGVTAWSVDGSTLSLSGPTTTLELTPLPTSLRG